MALLGILKKWIVHISIASTIVLGAAGYDLTNLSQAEFDASVPMTKAVNKKGVQYPSIVRDISPYGLSNSEDMFVKKILDGYGPTGEGEGVDYAQKLYFSSAVKMGLKPKEIMSGDINLYEYIRK